MNPQDNEIKIEQGQTPDKPEVVESPEAQEPMETTESIEQPKVEKTPKEKKEPTRLQKFFRKALIWLAVIVIAFGAGFLLDTFLRYRPLSEDLKQSQAEKDAIEDDYAALENQIEQLQPQLEAAKAKIGDLEDELEMAKARTTYYQVLVDVNKAQLELFLEELENAQDALAETQASLDTLTPFIEQVNPDLALSLPRRLSLIVDGLARDPETARIDLELFTKDLLALEPLLFEQ